LAQQHVPMRRRDHRPAALVIALLLPVLMGGCPEFRDQTVTAVETATRGLLDAALDLFFDQFRPDEFT